MPQKDVYSKKITSEEEQRNFVLVLKDRLSFFPEEGETFRLIHNGQPRKAKIGSRFSATSKAAADTSCRFSIILVEPRLLPSPDRLANWLNRWFKSIYSA